MRCRVSLILCACSLWPLVLLAAQVTKPDPKDQPRILVSVPLGVTPGKTTKVTLRGLKLDTATALRFADARVAGKILSKTKVAVPTQQEPARLGDTQIEAEIIVPADLKGATLTCTVATPGGDSMPYQLQVDTTPIVEEKEPNNSFRQAQPVQVGQTVEGRISQPQDVDVFRFEGREGQQVVLEVFAARYGSPLDSILTLYSAEAQQLAVNDDLKDTTDSRIEVTLPKTGVYYTSVIDAHDQGGPTFVYRLVIRGK
jgi:Bacterial pre-peptidase C-terminal domain